MLHEVKEEKKDIVRDSQVFEYPFHRVGRSFFEKAVEEMLLVQKRIIEEMGNESKGL
ncbi:MAG: hypothetical protein N2511_00660 [Thermodesulfovibrionales bacterium]|nr:hypothetical protein [Thermodesulfovibrionales bacterium]